MSKSKKVKKVKLGKIERREARIGYIFILPWLIGVVIFMIKPLLESFQYSLADIKMTAMGMKISFIGYTNYVQVLMEDKDFPVLLAGYFMETLMSVPIIVVFSLLIAMMLNGKIRMKGFFRLIFFLPVIIVSGPVMNLLTAQGAATIPALNIQAISSALNSFMYAPMAESITDVFSNIIMILWYSGVQILIFLSALQKIDSSLYEAAKIDGGSGWECFWKITMPTIKPMILLNAVYTVIFMSNNEHNAIVNVIQAAMFAGNKGYGYASAMAWAYSVLVTALVGIVALVLLTRKDAYDKMVKRFKKEQKKQARAIRRAKRRGKRGAARMEKYNKKTA
jgi:ABC-type sugar transport system permease subunit